MADRSETTPPAYWPDGRRRHISHAERHEWRQLARQGGHLFSRHTVLDLLDVLEDAEAQLEAASHVQQA